MTNLRTLATRPVVPWAAVALAVVAGLPPATRVYAHIVRYGFGTVWIVPALVEAALLVTGVAVLAAVRRRRTP
ncbi:MULTISPECIES: hypothetical protein [Streptomyces]|uniref:Uncharacterized protein n=1 Tax=Streptomyces canarius TaxID=285453 RepID=A0ABQ3CQL7_9ACTN|nr:hypothetical protein [Streptomyces canarius]GHA33636.1 hypothetical protein GCM10010345_42720 [Streptomyces canarius]